MNCQDGKDAKIHGLRTRPPHLTLPQHEEIGSACDAALGGSHFLRLGLSGALVPDLGTVWGDDRIDKFFHTEAHTGLEFLNAARHDRKERGRVVWIE